MSVLSDPAAENSRYRLKTELPEEEPVDAGHAAINSISIPR